MANYTDTGLIVVPSILTATFNVTSPNSGVPTYPVDPETGEPIPGSKPLTGWPSCDLCPEPVLSVLRQRTVDYLEIVRCINALSVFFQNLPAIVTIELVNKVKALVDAIPVPFLPDPVEILKYLTCPLTPLALYFQPDLLSGFYPNQLYKKVLSMYREWINEVEDNFIEALKSFAEWQVIKIFKQFIDSIKRMRFNTKQLVEGTLVALTVKATCDAAFRDSPFSEFLGVIEGFNIVNFVPSGLEGTARELALQLGKAAVLFMVWGIITAGSIFAPEELL